MKVALGSGAPHRYDRRHFLRRFPVVVSSSDHGAAHGFLSATPRVHVRGAVLVSVTVTVTVTIVSAGVGAVPAAAADAPPLQSGAWHRPVDGAVVRPFEQPSSVYGAGHRGVDFAAAPGTPVRAANDGIVTFAGAVAGTLHVTSRTAPRCARRTRSCSRSRSTTARPSRAATSSGLSGGTDDDHAGTVLHFGLRVGDRYVDPMLLFRPDDLTKLVRLVPDRRVDEQPWTPADERRELQASLHLPTPGRHRRPERDRGKRGRRRLRRRRPARGRCRQRGVRRRRLGRRPIGRGARCGPRRPRRRHRRRERRARRAPRPAPCDASRSCARSRPSSRPSSRARRSACSRSTSSRSAAASSTPSPRSAPTTRPRPTAPGDRRTA